MYLFRLVFVLSIASLTLGNIIDDLLNALKTAITCDACHKLALTLKNVAELGDTALVDVVAAVCKAAKVEDDDVCEGTVQEQGPILARVLRNISPFGATSSKLCNIAQLCNQPPINKYTVPLPAPAADIFIPASQGRQTFKVVHISDVHIDRQYIVGTESECSKPICCRQYADSTSDVRVPAGPFGSYQCDTPDSLLMSLFKQIDSPGSAFAIFTGDVVEAAVWSVTRQEVLNDINIFNDEMLRSLHMPVFSTIGNHEAAPANSFPTSDTPAADATGYDAQYVFDAASSEWTPWINATAADQVKHQSGSYSVVAPGTKLRIISLNTVYWYNLNLWIYDSDEQHPDPNGIMAFAVQELQAAEEAGQRVWIIGHMPPGGPDTLHDQSHYYDQIVQRYQHIIAGHFFGHSHVDQFEIAYNDYENRTADNAVAVSWIAPSVTPRTANGAFKVYEVDPDTYDIMDAHVYVANLSDPTFDTEPTWNLYYSARETYGALVDLEPTEPLGPAFWHRVTEKFEADDEAFNMYIRFMQRDYNVEPCDAECKKETICGLRAMRSEDNCVTGSTLALEARKPGTTPRNSSAHYDTCDGSGLLHILAKAIGAMTSDQVPEKTMNSLSEDLKSRIQS
ncbi:sphingomyelin phosphodiesterase [Hymenopellis radicata]|nr:sphingomyelin phosphodiesterase [Hymenopellis radicata]